MTLISKGLEPLGMEVWLLLDKPLRPAGVKTEGEYNLEEKRREEVSGMCGVQTNSRGSLFQHPALLCESPQESRRSCHLSLCEVIVLWWPWKRTAPISCCGTLSALCAFDFCQKWIVHGEWGSLIFTLCKWFMLKPPLVQKRNMQKPTFPYKFLYFSLHKFKSVSSVSSISFLVSTRTSFSF